jgi:PDZ domain-containing protein
LRKVVTPGRLAAVGLVLLALVAGLLLLVPTSETYIFLPDRARPLDPLVEVEGAKRRSDPGGIYFVDVIVRRATWMERLFPSIREGSSLVPAGALNPTGLSDAARRRSNLREMSRSQSIAAAVALRHLGYDVTATPTGALVVGVAPDTPAAGKVHPSDVIVAVDGTRVRRPDALRRLLGRGRPGRAVSLTVRRGGELETIRLSTTADPRRPNRPIIGVLVEQEADIDLPVSVRIDTDDVGGPSAGLAFALAVMEDLGRDVDGGNKVAVTGAIELDGDVSAVGGLRQKTIGAERAGVDVFLVPAGENAAEARRQAEDVRVLPVRSFQQALRVLATLPRKSEEE